MSRRSHCRTAVGRFLPLVAFLGMALSSCAGSSDSVEPGADARDARDAHWADTSGDIREPDTTALGPEGSLMRYARLEASATRVRAPFPWPRESEDGPQAIRDDQSTTSWKLPVGEPTTLELDLAPWYGAAAPLLSELKLVFEDEDGASGWPGAGRVILRTVCGGTVVEEIPLDAVEGPAELGELPARCVEVELQVDEPLGLAALDLQGRQPPEGLPEPDAAAITVPAERFANTGVVEGFYGVPWSWRERRLLVLSMAAQGMDTYVYAPKNDPLHRDRWRDDYDDETLDAFRELAAFGAELGVTVYFGLSPLIDFEFEGAADYPRLVDKLSPLLERGVRGVVLLGDDIEWAIETEVDAALGAKHVALVNRLLGDLRAIEPSVRLWFVPTVYSDARADDWEGGQGYLAALADLDSDVEYLWTGPSTGNGTMEAADMLRVTQAVGRKPLIWDNHWANDAGDGFTGRILLAPYSGRSADLQGAVSGIVQNPCIQGALARSAVATFGRYLHDPDDYDDAVATEWAVAEELRFTYGAAADADRDGSLLALVFELFDAFWMEVPTWAALRDAVVALQGQITSGSTLGVADVLPTARLCAAAVALPVELRNSGLDADITDELLFPVAKVAAEGAICLAALAVLAERLAGDEASDLVAAGREAVQRSATMRYAYGNGEVQRLFNGVASVEPAAQTMVQLALLPPPSCAAGDTMDWEVVERDGVDLEVWGLPGAIAEGGTVEWAPPHPGLFEATVVASTTEGDGGWSVASFPIVCE